jgi:hypothetical protein
MASVLLSAALSGQAMREFVAEHLWRGREYFVVLLRARELFARGLLSVPHGRPNWFYAALLRLPTEALADRRGESLAALPRHALEALGGAGRPEAEALEGACGAESEEALRQRALAVAGLGDVVRGRRVVSADAGGGRVAEIRLDVYSHASGEQRAYVQCPWHDSCFKYRQVSVFSSREVCFRWLQLWLQAGPAIPSKEEHKAYTPAGGGGQEAGVEASSAGGRRDLALVAAAPGAVRAWESPPKRARQAL